MGLFDIFKKKPEQEASAPEAGSAWARKFKGFWDWEDDRKRKVGFEFVADLATHFEKGKVKETTDEDDVEVRGRIEDVPVRIKYELDMGWVNLEMKCRSPFQELQLEWDPEKVPVHGGGDDDDWDDDDELRVFAGKAVFVEGDSDEVQQSFDALGSLPAELGAEIVQTMQQRKLTRFYVFPEIINVGFKDNAYEMQDPIAEILAVTGLMARVAKTLGSGQVAPPAPPQAGVPRAGLSTCSYCGTRFYLGPSSACPNCGAAFGT
jgi:hypothetical protein